MKNFYRIISAFLILSIGICMQPSVAFASTDIQTAETAQGTEEKSIDELSVEESSDTPELKSDIAAADVNTGTVTYAVEGGAIYFDPQTESIIDCDETVTKAEIPSQIEGVPVENIGSYAFENCDRLISVTIPDSITRIDDSAFYGCTALTGVYITDIAAWCAISFGEGRVNPYVANPLYYAHNLYLNEKLVTDLYLPEEVTTISRAAFSGCTSLTSVTIPANVTFIAGFAFYKCTGLTNIFVDSENVDYCDIDGVLYKKDVSELCCCPAGSLLENLIIPDSVTAIEIYAFSDCTNLISVTIPAGVEGIGYDTFSGCINLKEVVIPDSVISIQEDAFYKCISLNDVILPNSVDCIEDGAFFGCTSLTEIELPDSVTYIGDSAFASCTSLSEVTVPDSVTNLGSFIFSGCSNLVSVVLGSGVVNIGSGAFNKCSKLTDVMIKGEIINIGNFAFCDCISLNRIEIPDGVTNIGDNAFSGCTELANLNIPNSVTSIGDYAFSKCISLIKVTIPDSVTSMGEYVFSYCDALSNVVIGDGVTDFGYRTFYQCINLVDVVIGNRVTNIENYAFYGCGKLKNVTIGNSVSSIGDNAFSDCSSLVEINIPESVATIGKSAFKNCANLTNVYISDLSAWCAIDFAIGETNDYRSNPLYYADNLYLNGELVTNLEIPNGVTEIGEIAFRKYSSLTNVTIPESVTSIGRCAFMDCTGLKNITFSNGLTNIGEFSFAGCTGLTNIVVPNSVTRIEKGAFMGCTNLAVVTIGNGLDSISEDLFSDCSSLIDITIGNGVTRIEDYAFERCTSLESVTIPGSVTDIGERVFLNCSGLTTITIPYSVNFIDDEAFYKCNNLSDVYYLGSNSDWAAISIGSNNECLTRAVIHCDEEKPDIPEPEENSDYIIERVKEYTTDEFYAQYDAILNSNSSNEVILQQLTELFSQYGFLDVMEGVHYLSNTLGNRYAYRTLLSDEMYCAWNYYDWLHNTSEGTAARAVMVVDGLIFNNEFSEWTDITNYVDDDYPSVKKYKDMLYDFMDAEALEIEVMSYIDNINQISQKCTAVGKEYADSLVQKINTCTSREELNDLMESADAQELFRELKIESGEGITFSLSKESGFGKFANAMGYAGNVISIMDTTVDNAVAIIELDSKLKVYAQYQTFLSEIQSATELPLEMRLAARSILREMEEGEWHQIKAFTSDLIGELSEVMGSATEFNITDKILESVVGKVGAESLKGYLTVVNVSAFCINKIVDVGELIRGVQFVEGYVLLQNYYKEQLLTSRNAFVDNPTAENAWAFFEDYNILYRLRYRGEKAYLAMSDIKGAIRIFTDFGYPVKAEVAETTMNLLEERCQFTIDEGVKVPESVSYFTKTVIDCPVNVEVYSPEGELIATLMDGVESDISNEHGRFAVVYRPYTGEYAKVICLKEDGDYRFRLEASGDGLVSFKMASKSDQNPVLYSFDHVAVSTDEVIETSVEQVLKENVYSIDADGNGDFEGTGEILTSVPSDNIPVQSISLDETDLNLAVGESVVLNYSILPTEATCQNVLWISSDPNTVEISNGMATALKEGTAVVYCRSQDDLSLSAKCEIDVVVAHRHTMTLVSASEATCCSTGIKEHWHCTMCGKDFADSTGTIEMSDATIPVNAQNHTGGTEIRDAVKATSEAEGYTGDTYCLGCGARITSGTVIPKLTTDNPDAPAASEPTTEPSITRPSQPSTTTVPEKEAASNTAKAEDEEKTQAQETELPNEDVSEPSQTPQADGDESAIQKSDSTVQETEEQNQESGSSILVYVVLVFAAGCVIFGAVWYLWRRKKQ